MQPTTSIKPLGNVICILPETSPSKTKSGILIPDNAQKDTQYGRVVAAGPGARLSSNGQLIPMQTKVGDRVAFPAWDNREEFEIDGEAHFLMPENEITGIVD